MSEDLTITEEIAAGIDKLLDRVAPAPVHPAKLHQVRRELLTRIISAKKEEPVVQAILDANVTKLLADETLKIHQETERRWKEGK